MYHRRANVQAFYELLSFALKKHGQDGAASSAFNEKQDRYDALNALASHSFQLWEVERQRVVEEEELAQSAATAEQHYADGMQMANEMSSLMIDFQGQITRCFIFLMKGELNQARRHVDGCFQSGEKGGSHPEMQEPLLLIAQAILCYNEGKVADALQALKKLVCLNPLVPADIWLAIGICYFKLNVLPKAKFAIEHVLDLDPQNSMALTSLGIIELQICCSDVKQREKAVVLF